MAIVPADSARYTALRVVATAFPIGLAIGLTAVAFYLTDALGILFGATSTALQVLVLVPASVLAIITTVLAARILWNASEPADDQGAPTVHEREG